MDQGSLFDPDEARRRRDEGMERADRAADRSYERRMFALIRSWDRGTEFTADTIWVALGPPPGAAHHRALGPMLRRAANMGLCQPTAKLARSNRVSSHKAAKRVWVRL